MGLDMFAFSTKAKPKTEVDFETKNFDPEEIHYWRKHPNLHGWMRNLYEEKGGDKNSSFNGDCVVLTESDLDDLEHDLKQYDLPQTSGFFLVIRKLMMKNCKMIWSLLRKLEQQSKRVRRFITQVGGKIKI